MKQQRKELGEVMSALNTKRIIEDCVMKDIMAKLWEIHSLYGKLILAQDECRELLEKK